MDSIHLQDTGAWRFQVVAAFAIALGLSTIGILYLPEPIWVKGYLLMGLYFTVSSAFGLAKTLRDAHESSRIVAKISEAKTEKMLRELAQS
ncbi:MAG TPA: YiaA/YiaB family inner membrane protein [Polyangiales bacterium]|nr:YiaA/YiaB family inner membrane protein [Polyangiales bacterium]